MNSLLVVVALALALSLLNALSQLFGRYRLKIARLILKGI